MIDKLIYYGSYISIIGVVRVCYAIRINYKNKNSYRKLIAYFLVLVGLLAFMEMRFFEPSVIKVNKQKIQTNFQLRVGVISDIHLGDFKNRKYLNRLVKRLNKQNLDVVLILGDFVYKTKPQNFEKTFRPFKNLDMPAYGVLGNHDTGRGRNYQNKLEKVLTKYNVKILNNKIINLKNAQLIGLGSHMSEQDNIDILQSVDKLDNTILMMHNPDSFAKLNQFETGLIDTAVAGHTHGGQIRLPWLYKSMIPTKGDFDQGWYDKYGTDLFITSGIGEINLPVRFRNFPEIVILEFGEK